VAVDTTALETELTTDPKQLGYAALSDQDAADLLNKLGASNEVLPLPSVDAAVAMEFLALTDYLALSAGQQSYIALIASSGALNLLDAATGQQTQVLASLATIFPATTPTGAVLRAKLTRPASRAEILFGAGTTVDAWVVAHARGKT
jgi:hypothetical protein